MSSNINNQSNIKDIINNAISVVCSDASIYSENPAKDFLRNRKLPIEKLIHFLLNMEGNSLNSEIYNNFPIRAQRMTASAFIQQREKLKPDALKVLLKNINVTLEKPLVMKGLRVYGIDGSDFCTPFNLTSSGQPQYYFEIKIP